MGHYIFLALIETTRSPGTLSTRRVKRQYLHLAGICRTGRMYINIVMGTVLGTRVRSVPPRPWVKVSFVEETTKCHQKVKHWDSTTDRRTSRGLGKAPRQHGSFPEMEMLELTSGKKERKRRRSPRTDQKCSQAEPRVKAESKASFFCPGFPKEKVNTSNSGFL